jgi:lipocalin
MPDLGQKDSNAIRYEDQEVRRSNTELSACRGEGSAVKGAAWLQLRVRFVPAALLVMLRTALALQCVSKARDPGPAM